MRIRSIGVNNTSKQGFTVGLQLSTVHALLSLHVIFVKTHPVEELQLSEVHIL